MEKKRGKVLEKRCGGLGEIKEEIGVNGGSEIREEEREGGSWGKDVKRSGGLCEREVKKVGKGKVRGREKEKVNSEIDELLKGWEKVGEYEK